MGKWVKPSGLEIEINDDQETIDYVTSMGWHREGEDPLLSMSKDQLEQYARENLNIELDKRKSISNLIEDIRSQA